MSLKKTPLNALHHEFGARMIDFAGWEMPVQYQSALREHLAVRNAVGVFDVSHMGELEIRGPGALAAAQRVTCNDVSRISDGQAQYSAFLTPQGTIIDDIVLYRISEQHLFICVNAANREKDFRWLQQQCASEAVEILDSSDSYVQLAVQGPRAQSVLEPLTDVELASLRYYWFAQGTVLDFPALVSRTGYTGEDGFEIYLPPEGAEPVWRRLFEVGRELEISPAGLAARNTLRLEMRYALYGNDIDETTTPFESGLSWIVKLEKGDFQGRSALLEQKEKGLQRKLVGFQMRERGIARDHYPVLVEGQRVGEVTSGSYAPSLERAIGLTYLPTQQSAIGSTFQVEVRGRPLEAEVVRTPFLRK